MSTVPAVSAPSAPPINPTSLSSLPGLSTLASDGLPTTGLITSLGVGSGLDLNSLLSELQTNASLSLQPIETQESSTQAEVSAFGTIQSALTGLGDALNTLANPATFQAVSASVQGSSVAAAASASAPAGQYLVNVTRLATASSEATLGVASDTTSLGAGTVSFAFGDGHTASVMVPAGGDNLQSIADAINAANVGVQASLINDGSSSPWRLVLQASATGTDAAISAITFSGALGSSLSLDSATAIAGQNAAFTVNGVSVTSAGNAVQDAIAGTTLSLASTGASTVAIATDDSAISKNVQAFVSAYNSAIGAINQVASYNASTNVAGPLFSDSTVEGMRSQLASFVDGFSGDGGFSGLAQLGVTLGTDGTLSFNSQTFDAALAGNLVGVQQFFSAPSGTNGLASELDGAVQEFAGPAGMIDSAVGGLQSLLTSLQQQQAAQQQIINATMANYQQEFTALDTTIAQLNSTSSYLSQQFAAMDGSSSSSGSNGS